MRTFVIVNPKSANGSTAAIWPELRSELSRVLTTWDHAFTLAPNDATRLCRKAILDGYEMIVSVGGDGTANEIVTGFFADEASFPPSLIRRDVVLGVVRRGTGGDFARLLGLQSKLPEALGHLRGSSTRPCDVGLVEFVDHAGERKWRAFLNIASFGLSGLVDEKVNRTTKVFGGRVSFLLGALLGLVEYRNAPVTVGVDERPFIDGSMVVTAVCNGQYFGGGMRIAPMARVDDGRLDVVVLGHVGMKELASIYDLYTGHVTNWAHVKHIEGGIVEAFPKDDARVLLDVDGEQPGQLPARFCLVHNAIQIKTP